MTALKDLPPQWMALVHNTVFREDGSMRPEIKADMMMNEENGFIKFNFDTSVERNDLRWQIAIEHHGEGKLGSNRFAGATLVYSIMCR
jgi:hypothetical protein